MRNFLVSLLFLGLLFSECQASCFSGKHIEELISEMTHSSARQQVALDEVMLNLNNAAPYLFSYLKDERKLANRDVRLLNTFAKPSEKYFLTEAYSVGEVVVKILCDKAMICDQDFDIYNKGDRDKQIRKLSEWCLQKYGKETHLCRTSSSVPP